MDRGRLFRTKVQTVEARQVHSADWGMCREIAKWCGGELVDLDVSQHPDLALIYVPLTSEPPQLHTVDDGLYAEEGDWIVRFQTGEYRVYSDPIFMANFDPVVIL